MSGPKHRKCRICNEYYCKYYEGKKLKGFNDEWFYICRECYNDDIECTGKKGKECISSGTVKWAVQNGWWIGKCGINNLCILCRKKQRKMDKSDPIFCCRCLYKKDEMKICYISHGHTEKGSHGTKFARKWLCADCHTELSCECISF
jgi:hypothetical protein